MQRNIIQLSSTSKGISLPSKWVEKRNLQKGDVVDVLEKEGTLEVRAGDYLPPERKAALDADTCGRLLPRLFDNIVKKGYDEITVHFSQEVKLVLLKGTLSISASVVEIVQKKEHEVTYRAISELDIPAMENIQRRIIFVLREQAAILKSFCNQPKPGLLDDLLELEKSNNKLVHLYARALNRNPDFPDSLRLYVLNWALEKAANDFKFIAMERPIKMSEPFKSLLLKLLDNLIQVISLYNSFDVKKAAAAYEARKRLDLDLLALMKKNSSAGEHVLIHHALAMNQRCMNLLGLLVEIPSAEQHMSGSQV